MPVNINVFAMNLGELETEVLRKLWINPSEDSNGWPAPTAFGKYSEYRIKKKLNKYYSDMVCLARAVRSWFIVTLKNGYSQYPVPINCFDINEVYYFSSPTVYTKLDVYEEDLIETKLAPGWRSVPSVPQYAYTADRNKMMVKLGVAPAPNTDGTAPTLDSTILSSLQPFGAVDAVSGVAGPGSSNLTYIDSTGQNLAALGVAVGFTIVNKTDGSYGVISSITTTGTPNDTIVCTSMSSGATNVWAPGNEMRILGGEYNTSISVSATDATYLLSPTVGFLPTPGITMAAGNLLVRGFFQPALLVDKNQYPELHPTFHQPIALGAAADLGMEEPADSPEFAQAQVYLQSYNAAVSALSTFAALQYKSSGVQIQSRRT